ncbi:LysR family transcriptional regulator [Burkholderia pseudomultivorans]|uniref:LysR family transcriptional regulator n=1 Tax=Burkholderia pseudomultivorans TaxID=1207504 RepID=UPI00075ACBD2|nr:LysR family transcriptional regulator [Burkholderia pseudomultivorans]KWI54706.1 LysR family transcriptional regulator [Burkholderia pseudomultivorans]
MDWIEPLQIFVRVADMGSFTHSAESLGISKGRTSAVLSKLEAEVGARLLHRTTRSVRLTEDGRAFYERALALLADLDELQVMFDGKQRVLRGALRVDLPTEIARNIVVPALPDFIAEYPELKIELSSTDRRTDLVQEGIDCVVRVGPLEDSSLVARRIGSLRMVNAGSPGYLARYGMPQTLDDLVADGHRIVHYSPTLGSRPLGWEYAEEGGYRTLPLQGMLQVNSVQTYEAAGLAGIGLIQAAEFGLRGYIDSGALIEVLPNFRAPPLPVSLIVAHRKNMSRRVRAFMEWVEGVLHPYLENEPNAGRD